MKRNVGNKDSVIRIVLAVVGSILYFGGIVSGIPGIILLIASGIFLLTGLINFCPLYSLFGMSSCPIEETPQ